MTETEFWAEVVRRLEALPEKKLLARRYYKRGCVCAVGAWYGETRAKELEKQYGGFLTYRFEEDADLATQLDHLQIINDEFVGGPEARYAYVVRIARRLMDHPTPRKVYEMIRAVPHSKRGPMLLHFAKTGELE